MKSIQPMILPPWDDPLFEGVLPFLRSLFTLLMHADPAIICWNKDGTAFEIHDVQGLVEDVLPQYFFQHSIKFTSFQRQLNKYGFSKKKSSLVQVCTYYGKHFTRDNPYDLALITRQQASNKNEVKNKNNMNSGKGSEKKISKSGKKGSKKSTVKKEEKKSIPVNIPQHTLPDYLYNDYYAMPTPMPTAASHLSPMAMQNAYHPMPMLSSSGFYPMPMPLATACQIMPTTASNSMSMSLAAASHPMPMLSSADFYPMPTPLATASNIMSTTASNPMPMSLAAASHSTPMLSPTDFYPMPIPLATASHIVTTAASHPMPVAISTASHPIPMAISNASHLMASASHLMSMPLPASFYPMPVPLATACQIMPAAACHPMPVAMTNLHPTQEHTATFQPNPYLPMLRPPYYNEQHKDSYLSSVPTISSKYNWDAIPLDLNFQELPPSFRDLTNSDLSALTDVVNDLCGNMTSHP